MNHINNMNNMLLFVRNDILTTLHNSINNLSKYDKCNCKKQLEIMLFNLNIKTVIQYVNIILDRNRQIRLGKTKCIYSHSWCETRIRNNIKLYSKYDINTYIY